MSGAAETPDLVYVIEMFPSDTLNFVYNEIRILEAQGLRVEIHSLQPGGLCPAEASEFAGRTRTLGPVSAMQFACALWYYLWRRPLTLARLLLVLPWDNQENRAGKAVRIVYQVLVGVRFAWVLRGRSNHIHAHFAFKAATAALVAAELNRLTFSFTSHGSDTVVPNRRFCLRSKVRQALFVVAVSEYNRNVLSGLCPEVDPHRIVVNRTGVLLEQFPRRLVEPAADDGLHIVCVASLYPVKNHEGLVRACGELARRNLRFRLSLAGKDVDGAADRLRSVAAAEKISAHVALLGVVDHGQVADLLAAADVCILASFSEGIPVSLMEAMARGVPVVGPAVTGVAELVRDGVTGLLVDPNDPVSIADALQRLARDSSLRARLTEAGREHVEAEFDMTKNARRLGGLFRERLKLEPSATAD
jgi:glycosyltransferase involved in cell wall biosynthesis